MANIIRAAIAIVVSMAVGFLFGMSYPIQGIQDIEHASLLSQDAAPAASDVTRTAILNTLAERYGYRAYLEIGQGDRRKNYDWIECPIRIGIDPEHKLKAAYRMTSDEFFEINNDDYDLIFIDGLHTEEQTYRDIINSLEVLSKNGSIVVHDCNPTDKAMQAVPRIQKVWTGDVWKAWVKLRESRDDLHMFVIDADFGCGVIRRGRQQTITLPEQLNYEEFDSHRTQWLNLVSVSWFVAEMKGNI